jgi:hypothetical protein
MTIEFTRSHAVLFGVLFLVEFAGLWMGLSRSPYLQDFLHHANLAVLAWWLICASAGSAFLVAVIVL